MYSEYKVTFDIIIVISIFISLFYLYSSMHYYSVTSYWYGIDEFMEGTIATIIVSFICILLIFCSYSMYSYYFRLHENDINKCIEKVIQRHWRNDGSELYAINQCKDK